MFYLRKIATYPFECLPVERLYRKERKLATFKLGLKTASSPVRAGQRNRVHANTSAEHKSVWTRTWETIKKEALYLDHVIYELKFARVFSIKDPINPLNRYVPEFCITLVNRDFLRLPITFLMFYKFAFKGAKDLQTNIKNLGIYALRKGECERNGTAFHSSFNYNYFLNYGLLLWSPIALLFTGVKFRERFI
jgi:hypothetical protein